MWLGAFFNIAFSGNKLSNDLGEKREVGKKESAEKGSLNKIL